MRDYELVVLYHPDLEIDLEKPLKKVEGLISEVGGKISFSDNWGKRRLAYPIKKQEYGLYVYYEIQLEHDAVDKLEGLLNIADEVIRYLVSKPSPTFGDREAKSATDDEDDKRSSGSRDKSDDKESDDEEPQKDKKDSKSTKEDKE